MSEFDATIGAVDLQPEATPTPLPTGDHEFWRIFSAEALGTFFLVLLGCGAAVVTDADVVATGLTFGIAVLISATAFARISGGHFNPAVTVGAAVSGRLSWRETPVYFGAQLVGAIVAGLALFTILNAVPTYDAPGPMGANGFGDHSASHLAWWGALLVEILLTALFLWIILAVTDERTGVPTLAPVAIGLTLAAIHFVAIPLTGTSVNPARSIGPALFAGGAAIGQLWLFILAPLVGAVIAGVTYPLLFGRDTPAVHGSGLGVLTSLTARRPKPAPAASTWSQPNEQTSETTYTAGAQWPQRIVQDGWEWDYAAQQWKPVEEPPAQP